MRLLTGDPEFDIWKFMNWIVVSYYWLLLSDFGQTNTTYYNFTDAAGIPNASAPLFYSSTNNIFVNGTLFTIYSSYLASLLSLLPTQSRLDFLPVDGNNSLQPTAAPFVASYYCTQKRFQYWINAVIAVLVADYVLIFGGYKLLVTLASWWQRRRSTEGKPSSDQPELVANICEGCIALRKNIPLDSMSSDDVEEDGGSGAESPLMSTLISKTAK
jgi:hypothetical protein